METVSPSTNTEPCPACGSKIRVLKAAIGPDTKLRIKAGEVKERNSSLAVHMERGLHKATGRRHIVVRLFDRIRNRYVEQIKDEATGEIIREVDQPLSDHRGRGADKPKPQLDDG